MHKTLRFYLHEALLTCKKSVEQLSDETNIGTSLLYRICNPEDKSAKFNIESYVPFLKATNNYDSLKHINFLCNKLTVDIPQLKLNKKEKTAFVTEYQEVTVSAAKKLLEHFEDVSNDKNYEDADKALQEVLELVAAAQLRIKAEHSGQFELYL